MHRHRHRHRNRNSPWQCLCFPWKDFVAGWASISYKSIPMSHWAPSSSLVLPSQKKSQEELKPRMSVRECELRDTKIIALDSYFKTFRFPCLPPSRKSPKPFCLISLVNYKYTQTTAPLTHFQTPLPISSISAILKSTKHNKAFLLFYFFL